jgi:hypothetical protein
MEWSMSSYVLTVSDHVKRAGGSFLLAVEMVVQPSLSEEFLLATAFHKFTTIEDDDPVGFSEGRKSVSNNDDCPPSTDTLEVLLDDPL